MDKKRETKISKFLSLVLRHRPELIGASLEDQGWLPISELIEGARKANMELTEEEIEYVEEHNDKQRFSIDGGKIRANQGHTKKVEIDFEQKIPPLVLFHGTNEDSLNAIYKHGLKKMKRHHVHLSGDIETATKVGSGRGKVVILRACLNF